MWPFHCLHILISSSILLSCAFKYSGVADFLEHTSELEKAGAAILVLAIIVGFKELLSGLFGTHQKH
jgi:hypothetical protein